LKSPICRVNALHDVEAAAKASADTAMGLQPAVCIAKGAQVMITSNICVAKGVHNGALGTILYAPGSTVGKLPFAEIVELDK
jgi:ATP-dependent exoDNAse (exonuclease V) alpha subunit